MPHPHSCRRLAATSGATASRQIVTPVTSRSSSAQPVIGIDPVTPVLSGNGVSMVPNGGVVAPVAYEVSDIPMVCEVPPASVSVIVTLMGEVGV